MKISLGLIGAEQQYCPAIALLPKPLKLYTTDFGALQLVAAFGNDWQSFHCRGSDSDSSDSLPVPRGKVAWWT